MKLLKTALLLSVLATSAMASKREVEIVIDKDAALQVSAQALYSAKNTLCKEIRGSYIYPHVAQRTKKITKKLSGSSLTFEKSPSGFCRYKLDSVLLKVSTASAPAYNSSYIAAYITNGGAGQIAELDCTVSEKGVECLGDSIRLDDENRAEVKLNLL